MVGLIALVICAIGLLNTLLNTFPSNTKKPVGYHEPIAKPGREGSFYFDDYDYFEVGVGGECVCDTCSHQRFTVSQNR